MRETFASPLEAGLRQESWVDYSLQNQIILDQKVFSARWWCIPANRAVPRQVREAGKVLTRGCKHCR